MSDLTNKKFRLQILNHEEVFATREKALTYITKYLKPDVLKAEPAVVFYGDENAPNVILAIGTDNREAFTIDLAELEEELAIVKSETKDQTEKVNAATKAVQGIIDACGLKVDDNKINNQVVYEPKDEIIKGAENIAEAIEILSKYVQKVSDDSQFSIADTNSVKLVFKENEKGENILKAKVKVSDNGDSDDKDFNDNILGVKSDGLYAAVHLEYDDLRNELTFYSSGVKDGRFQDVAKKQVINLGKHTKVTTDNNGHNVKLTIDSENVISGDVKIDESREYNILKSSDGGIYVEGKAKNIKYKGTNVLDALSDVENKIGEFKLEVNKNKNILKLTIGDKTEKVELPGIEFIEEAKYDDSSKTIIIKFKNGNQIFIPVDDMFLDVTNKIDDLEKANLKTVQDLIGEINERKNQAETILAKIDQEIADREHADEDIKHLIDDLKIDELKQLVDNFQKEYGDFVKTWTEKKTEIETILNQAKEVIDKTEGRVATLEEGLKDEILRATKAEGNLQGYLQAEVERAIGAESVITRELGTEVTRAKGEEKRIEDKIDISVTKLEQDLTETNNNLIKLTDRVDIADSKLKEQIDESFQAINNTFINSKEYTDTKVGSEVDKLKAKDNEIETNVKKKIEKVRIEKVSDKDLLYYIYATIDGLETKADGEINIPKDQFLDDVKYDSATNSLVFTWAISSEGEEKRKETTHIPITQFVKPYKSGDGLKFDEETNTFSVKVRTNEKYLQVTEDGIESVGIDDKFSELEESINGFTAGVGLQKNDKEFSILLDEHNEGEYLTVTKQGLSLNGINEIKNTFNDKLEREYYNKTEIDNTFLKEHQDISGLAKTTELEEETEERKNADKELDEKILKKANASEVYNKETTDLKFLDKNDAASTYAPKFTVENSDTIELHMSDEKVLKSALRINSNLNNALLVNGNGAYVNVSLTYTAATNTLTFDTGNNNTTDITLTGVTAITGGYYDAKEKRIVLTVAGGSEIQIPVTDLVGQLTAINTDNDPVNLVIDYNGEGGKNTIQAKLNISDSENNLILKDNGTLFASKQAESMTADWGEVVNENLQSIITKLKDRTDGIEVLKTDVNDLKTDVTNAKADIGNIQVQLGETDINELKSSVDKLNDRVEKFEETIEQMRSDIQKLQDIVGDSTESSDTILDRLAKLEDFIENKLIDFGVYDLNN